MTFREISRLKSSYFTYVRIKTDAVWKVISTVDIQLLSKIFLDSDFCHNYLHTQVVLNHTLDFTAIENFTA